MKKWFIGVWHPSVVMTYTGLAFSIVGVGIALHGRIARALIFLVLAALCDMFDGIVAQRFKRTDAEKEFGVQIDSLVDVCSFVIFPLCLLFCICESHTAAYVVAAIYAVAGVARLAWFNITTHEEPNYFVGLPVIYSALLLPATYLLLSLFQVSSNIAAWIWYGLYLLMAIFFVCNFKTRKPRLVFRLVMLVVAITLIVALLFVS